jgi:tetratricopeptide (TPR) repeat protein
MRRILLALVIAAAGVTAAAPAQAGWGWHRGCGWGGGWGGYRGGYGYSVGYRGFGCGPSYGGYGLSIGCYRPVVSCYSAGYGYGGYYSPLPIGYYGYYGSTYNPGSNFVALSVSSATVARPALVARPATVPGAVRNLLDMSREDLLAALRAPAGAPAADPLPRIGGDMRVTTISAEKPVVSRISNAEQRRQAEQSLAIGDVLFREQKFHSALQRYKLASQQAPDMAETYWRQGHALIATANYELAGGAFKRALALDPDVTRGEFTLSELYRGAEMAKSSHLESLAGWALTRGDISEPYFLMGVQLYYDGQRERASKFFGRAAELAGPSGGHLIAFAPAGRKTKEADAVPPLPPEPAGPIVERKPASALPVSAPTEI